MNNPERYLGPPLRKALDRSILHAQGITQENTPVDRGRARNSFTTKVDRSQIPLFATLGSNLDYIRPLEEGSRPHWPPFGPGSDLALWARRHGITPFLVARAIARRGTQSHEMLKKGIDGTRTFFNIQLRTAANEIERLWKS